MKVKDRRVPELLTKKFISTALSNTSIGWFMKRRLTNTQIPDHLLFLVLNYHDAGYLNGMTLLIILDDMKRDVSDMYCCQLVNEVKYPMIFKYGYIKRIKNVPVLRKCTPFLCYSKTTVTVSVPEKKCSDICHDLRN